MIVEIFRNEESGELVLVWEELGDSPWVNNKSKILTVVMKVPHIPSNIKCKRVILKGGDIRFN